MLVIRHVKGSNSIFLYGIDTSGNTYQQTLTTSESVRTRKTQTDQILTLGSVRFMEDGGHDYYGSGWLHWCKIWYDDLGAAAAKELASWPRETLRMNFSGPDRYRLAAGTSARANASFFSENTLTRRCPVGIANYNVGGWDASLMRTFANTRVYNALPKRWSIIFSSVRKSD